MRIAYLDCMSGISGDMTLGALVDAGVPLERIREAIDAMGIHGLSLESQQVRKNGFRATQVHVHCPHEHAHRHLSHILGMIESNAVLTVTQKELATKIFTNIAHAEALVHGVSADEVHFHEVGAADSIADIVGAAVGWDLLGVEKVYCSEIPTGTGTIHIAHGECTVPAPATAELLKGIPIAASEVPFELTTPTGAAIVKTMVAKFGAMPSMVIERVACGAGQRDLPNQPNILRLFVGEQKPSAVAISELEQRIGEDGDGVLWVLETDIDDCNGEWVGHTRDRLLEQGALDVVLIATQMKKGRPGTRISVLCDGAKRGTMETILLTETTTIGVRAWPVIRNELRREFVDLETPYGVVRGKVVRLGQRRRFAPEYEVCRRLAEVQSVPLAEIYRLATAIFETKECETKYTRPT